MPSHGVTSEGGHLGAAVDLDALIDPTLHSSSQMFQSDEGIEALYGSSAPPDAPPPRPLARPSTPFLF